MKRIKTTSFQQADPVFSFEQDKVIFRDGRVGIGFLVEPAEMESWEKNDYESAQQALMNLLRIFPAQTIVQKSDIYYERVAGYQNTAATYFESKMNAHFAPRPVLYHNSYLFVSFAPTAEKTSTRTNALNALIARGGEAIQKNPFASLPLTLELAERNSAELLQSLRVLKGVTLTRLGEKEIRRVYAQYFNLDFEHQPTQPARELSNAGATGLRLGEHQISVVSMIGQGTDSFPAVAGGKGYNVTQPMIYPLTHYLQCPHILTQAFLVNDTRTALKSLDNDRKLNKSLARLATQDNILRSEEIELFTAEVRAENKSIVGLHTSVLLWESDARALRENVEKVTSSYRQIFGTESVVESFLALYLYFGLLPGNAYQIPDRWLTTSTDRALCYLHWITSYRSDKKGEYLCDRFRNLLKVNLFNTNLDNQNAVIIGPSGSGKSYFFGNLVVQRFEKGARQIIIDIGLGAGLGSYRNVVQSLNGADFENTYFEYDPENPIEFNPFLIPRKGENGPWLYNDDKLNFHLTLISALWKGTTSGNQKIELDKSERAIIGRFLKEYYKTHLNQHERLGQVDEEFPGMQGFFDYLTSYHYRMSQPVPTGVVDADHQLRVQHGIDSRYIDFPQLFLILSEFVAGGRYEKVLNARRDKDLSQYHLICFDLAKVKTDPTLYPVVGMLITELALDLFRQFPDDVKYIALDEAWALLAGVLEEFIVSMYRTIRKTNGSITIITQGIKEITDSKIGYTLIDNSSTKIILRHSNKDSLDRIQVPLGFTSHEMDLCRSVQSGDGFREFFIKQGSKGQIYTLEVSPQLDAILSSKPTERNYLNRLVEHYKREVAVPVRDKEGRIVLNPETNEPVMTTFVQKRLAPAVDQFVEDKMAQRGALAI